MELENNNIYSNYNDNEEHEANNEEHEDKQNS